MTYKRGRGTMGRTESCFSSDTWKGNKDIQVARWRERLWGQAG